jgi:hypothetical protein
MTTKTTPRKKPRTSPGERPTINQTAIDLLLSWTDGDEEDEQEQRETMHYLRVALDEGRPPELKHFP